MTGEHPARDRRDGRLLDAKADHPAAHHELFDPIAPHHRDQRIAVIGEFVADGDRRDEASGLMSEMWFIRLSMFLFVLGPAAAGADHPA